MEQDVVQTLGSLKDEVRLRYRADLRGIFGSWARGEAQADSDVDVLVEFQKGATLLDLAGLGDFLEERLRRKVDVVSQRAIRDEIRSRVYRDLLPV